MIPRVSSCRWLFRCRPALRTLLVFLLIAHADAGLAQPAPSPSGPAGSRVAGSDLSSAGPAVSHSTRGREDCLECHGPAMVAPAGPGHETATNVTCVACHVPDPAAPAFGSRADGAILQGLNIPHLVLHRGDCLLCHGKAGPVRTPASHEGRGNGTCQDCHLEAPDAAAHSLSAGMSPAPVTGHPVQGPDCLACHGPSSPAYPGVSHRGRGNSTCLACHPEGSPTGRTDAMVAATMPSGEDACFSCHANRSLVMTLESGESVPLYIDRDEYGQSLHGDRLTCKACHGRIEAYPHPPRDGKTVREYTLKHSESCRPCHFDNFTKTLDGIHYKLLAEGDTRAPSCSDCHGSHVVDGLHGRSQYISLTCARCHPAINDQFSASVHGKALTEGNPDVPTCTSCHGAHGIQDPRSVEFHVASPDLCATCHTDATVMDKYGISTNVLQSYLQDFHGMTTRLYREEGAPASDIKATCVDCHGIHDIRASDDPESHVIKQNLVATCEKCHPGSTDNFPDAWLSHYDPTPSRYPIVYWVKQFYLLFVPLTVGGLGAHILLDLVRWVLNRRQRRKGSP